MKNSNYLPTALALIVLMFTSFVAPDADAQRRRAVERHSTNAALSGVVTDAGTGEPIAGAEVTILGTTRKANNDGEYEFEIAVGTWEVTAHRWGYTSVTREIEVGQDGATADFELSLAPWVTLTRTGGQTERYATETVEFGYAIPFTGTFSSPELKVCTGDPNEPITIERGSIAQIKGPAQRVDTTCCPNFQGEQINIERKSGETFDAVILDSCPPYEIYFIGRNLDTRSVIYRRLTEVDLIAFP